MKIDFKRGDIIDVDLDGALGAEKRNDDTAGCRPCVVVQNNVGNEHSPMTIVAPLTDARQAKGLPVQAVVEPDEMGFESAKKSVVECGQLRTIDRQARVLRKRGSLTGAALRRVDAALAVSVGLA